MVLMQKLLIFRFLTLMAKFKHRIMTAKKLLKGTSGAKDSIILQRLYLFFRERKKKKPMQMQEAVILSAH